MNTRLDFDGDPIPLVEAAFRQAESAQSVMHDQYQRDWLLYKAFSSGDPDMPNLSLPKMYTIVESKTPQLVKALYGRRPYIPFTARRPEYKEIARVYQDFFDELLHRGGFYTDAEATTKMSILYGTAYMNVLPYYELVDNPQLVDDPVNGLSTINVPAFRLRLRMEQWGPWDVLVDPMAKGLEQDYDCRYVIKVQQTTVREIKEGAARGSYPNLDIEELDWNMSKGGTLHGNVQYGQQPFGRHMLEAFGLPYPQEDDDACILLRYESSYGRYIDLLNGDIAVRDGASPFPKMKGINLSRMIHTSEPHSNHRFYGQGEAKINEVQIAMLNDLWKLTFSAHGITSQPLVFFRKGAVRKEDLVWGMGQRIPIKSNAGRPITDEVMVTSGESLPRDHYLLPNIVSESIDSTAANYPPNRGDAPGGGTTATAVLEAGNISDERAEAFVMLRESVFNSDFQRKGTAILSGAMNINDLAEIVGQRDAMLAYMSVPMDMPGGHNIVHRGSDRMATILGKRAALERGAPFLMQSRAARMGGIDRKYYQLNDFSEDEITELVMTPEEIEMMQKYEIAMAASAARNQLENRAEERADQKGAK